MTKDYVEKYVISQIATNKAVEDFIYSFIARKLTILMEQSNIPSFSEAFNAALDGITWDTEYFIHVNAQNTDKPFMYADYFRYDLPI